MPTINQMANILDSITGRRIVIPATGRRRDGLTDNQRKVGDLIIRIPEGYLISYNELKILTCQKYNLRLQQPMVARTRRKIYHILVYPHWPDKERDYKHYEFEPQKNWPPILETIIPLHRIASRGDVWAVNDSFRTRPSVLKKRRAEGSLDNPKWIEKLKELSIYDVSWDE